MTTLFAKTKLNIHVRQYTRHCTSRVQVNPSLTDLTRLVLALGSSLFLLSCSVQQPTVLGETACCILDDKNTTSRMALKWSGTNTASECDASRVNPRSLGWSPFNCPELLLQAFKDRIVTVPYFLLKQIEIGMLYNTKNTIPCVFKNRSQKLGHPCCCSPNLLLSPAKVPLPNQLICLGQDGMSHTTLTSYPHSFMF